MGLIVGFFIFGIERTNDVFDIDLYGVKWKKNGGWRVLYMGKMNEIW